MLWGNLAEIAEKYLRKGSSVFIQGKMRTRSYDDKNGVKRYITEIEGEIMQMLDRRADNATSSSMQNDKPSAYSNQQPQAPHKDNDLPF